MRASASRAKIKIAQDVGGVVRLIRVGERRVIRVHREFAVRMTVGRESGDICSRSADGNREDGGVGLIRECR